MVCYARFVSANTVTGQIDSIRMASGTFQLASVGNKGIFHNLIGDRAENGSDWTAPDNTVGTFTNG